jgi:hypothetical protein
MSIVTRSAVLVILAIGILGCSITEPPGPPSTGTTFGTTLTLTHDQPVAITSLAYSGRAGDQAVSGITGYIEVVGQGGGGPGSETHPDVGVSLLNVETGASTDAIGVRCGGRLRHGSGTPVRRTLDGHRSMAGARAGRRDPP